MKKSKHSPLLEKLLARAADVAGLIKIDERGNVIVTEADKRRIIDAGAELVHKIVVAESRNKLDEMEAGDDGDDDDCSCDTDDDDDGSKKDDQMNDYEDKVNDEELEPVEHDGIDDEPVAEDGDEGGGDELSDDEFKRIGNLLNTDAGEDDVDTDSEESDVDSDDDSDDDSDSEESEDDEDSDDEDMKPGKMGDSDDEDEEEV